MNESESNKRHSGSAAHRKHGSGGFSGGGNRGKRYDKSGSSDRKHRGNNRDFNKKISHRGNNHKAKYASGRSGPKKSGYREERSKKHLNEPSLPPDISERDLDPTVRQDLRSLSKQNAEVVAKHMVASALAMEEDPELALKHARAAKDRAGRVSIARETCGIAAYHAGQWKEALSELRAARRISGGPGLLAVMADCERGLGHPEKAISLGTSDQAKLLDSNSAEELAIVVAGARRDLEQYDAAVVGLEQENLDEKRKDEEAPRLFYAYADSLAAAGRTAEAKAWFQKTIDHDPDELLDAKERLAELN
ncbi:tetratricopeptide repeat protein [Corynebacterium pseudokroppenstedtii]|uniref:Tetratricopeptide repeat protein n=1 Tax=Corynebacterium pseudokroppenstedtii TaxID=2804917 RepID=A0AAU0Q106_9CORY|nr:tetratricopeptide repeat protein [Corynebacterium pseudokroppenstedtii]QRP15167.1 tetratricopeptide repeat protein [Corynebacterium kroppenstedtii]MBY0790198.1 tetratricopeptide repeat protein [Corynebacterium pseudokroppenstedtii]MCF6794314.1 tetratricopeptide repeat protein [Corynebacterium pseudokroppenstedtii]MCF8703789.1 tetratricopeptide repeat protein [Corynebacterium pseudokroppenstedtii]MCG2637296.1 tetratricopeptide repeat protein [Corynebacterium pseudokroppenstedtii]